MFCLVVAKYVWLSQSVSKQKQYKLQK